MRDNSPLHEPAVYLQVVNAVVAALVAFGVLNGTWADAVGIAASGVVAVVTAVMTRPVVVSAITGGVQTLLTAVALVGAPITEQQSGALLTVLAVVLGLVLRQNVTPVTKADADLAA